MTPDDRDGSSNAPTVSAVATTQPGGTAATDQDTIVPLVRDSTPVMLPAPGYTFGDVIGRGGMGEVVTAHDRRIGRDVAVKRMRGAHPSDADVNRFLREARIQARLDHPAIVPVHELGVGDDNRPYFTMKRLAGVTLGERLREDVPLQRLLRTFGDICLAIAFAHERGVIHRDLKPANIMLGDYGEVYVIDWGIARVLGESQVAAAVGNIDTLSDGATQSILGTPGYMAPEQIRGGEVTPAADVYALGAILFEVLAREPLHERGTGAIASTLAFPQHSPAERAPGRDIPPELDEVCVAALAPEPGDRPSARELGERIEKYLDGDRDVERRRELAKEQLALAQTAVDSGDPEQRATAVRCAGRALALDPQSTDAARMVTSLIVKPPAKRPTGLDAVLDADERDAGYRRNRTTAWSLVGIMSVSVFLPWMHIRSWTTLGLIALTVVSVTVWMFATSKRAPLSMVRTVTVAFVLALAFTRIAGAFMLTPIMIAGSTLALTGNPTVRKRPVILWLWLAAVIVTPYVLEATHVFAPSMTQIGTNICVESAVFVGQPGSDMLVLALGNVVLLVTMANYALRLNRQVMDARADLKTQAWHLEQLLPTPLR
jgi:serine/threonine-protein kinase